MKRILANRRGNALVYVLFAIVLLGLLTPPILAMTSSRTSSDKALGNDLAASQLASSAMESFFSYLNASGANGITGNTWNGYVSNYPGWTPPAGIPITLPDGSKMTLCQQMCVDKQCSQFVTPPLPSEIQTELNDYYVRVRAVAGDDDGNLQPNERYARAHELVKAFPIQKKGAARIIDPDSGERTCVNAGQSGVIYGGSTNQSGAQKNTAIAEIIGEHLANQEQKTQEMVTQFTYQTQGESCETFKAVAECKVSEIISMYNQKAKTGSGPIYIKAKRLYDNAWNNTVNLGNLGTADRPLILIVDQIDTEGIAGTLTGDLVVTGNAKFANVLSLRIVRGYNVQHNLDFGGFYVMGNQTYSNMLATFTVEGTNYCGQNMSFINGGYTINARSLTVIGSIVVQNAGIALNTNGGIVSTGSLNISSSLTSVNTVNGDLYVRDNLTSSSSWTNIHAGGVVAVGGDLQMNNGAGGVSADGKNTTLFLPGVTGECNTK